MIRGPRIYMGLLLMLWKIGRVLYIMLKYKQLVAKDDDVCPVLKANQRVCMLLIFPLVDISMCVFPPFATQ